MKKKLTVLILTLCAILLCSCASFDAAGLLQGNLDLIYLNQYTDAYLESVDLTAEEADQQYADGIEAELEYFADYFDIDLTLCSDELKEQIREFYRNVYSHSKYEVGSAANNSGTYVVSLTIYPIDIIQQFMEKDADGFMTVWEARYNNGEFDAMTDQEFEAAWVSGILGALNARLPDIGYQAAESIAVQIAKDETDGLYVITDNDFGRIDSLIIAY